MSDISNPLEALTALSDDMDLLSVRQTEGLIYLARYFRRRAEGNHHLNEEDHVNERLKASGIHIPKF